MSATAEELALEGAIYEANWQRVNLAAPEFAKPTQPPAICDLIYLEKRTVISGPPEATKTLAALIFGLEHIRAGGGFAFIDFEMGENAMRLLLDDLGATLDEIASVYYVAPDGPPETGDIAAMAAAGVTLAVIDAAAGAYDASGLDDMARKDVERFSRTWIRPLFKRGIATIQLDHVVKNADNRGSYAIGSERKLGAVDVHLRFEPITQLNRGGAGRIRIVTKKDRPGHLQRPNAAELALTSDPETHRIGWTFLKGVPATGNDFSAGDTWRPTALMERVLEHVSQPDYQPVSRSALANTVKGKRGYVLQAVDALLEDGQLRLDGKQVVPVPGYVPGTYREGNGNVPSLYTGNGNGYAEITKLAA